MKFIFSDSLDYIDPNYDFISDAHCQGRKPYWNDVFPHEFMRIPPYDGILVSRAIVGDHLIKGKYTESQAMRFRREGARSFLRYPEQRFPGSLMFGDCGAFQYHAQEFPPYSPENMLNFYCDCGFTHGCSVDHIIFECDPEYDHGKPVPEEWKRRHRITLENAELFLRGSRQLGNHFTPLGVVQAWSPGSMADSALELVKMGYNYIALGGLVPLRVPMIKQVLQAVQDVLPTGIGLHVLGFAKANLLDEFTCFNITSFDTTSPLIHAFKDSSKNYWSLQDTGQIEYYHALRIPQAYENNRIKNLVKAGKLRQEDVVLAEGKALDSVRAYAKGKANIDDALESLMNYTRLTLVGTSSRANTAKLDALSMGYRRTLLEHPWEKCSCNVCRQAGIEVVIYRASNRNKRRGIHNLFVFHNYVQNIKQYG